MKGNWLDKLRKTVPWFHREYLVVLCVILFVSLLALVGLFDTLESDSYDVLLRLSKAPVERPDVVMFAIDDEAVEKVGVFPWSRDVMADAAIRMRELGARKVVFDIEYPTPSSKGVNPEIQKKLPGMVEEAETSVSEYIINLMDAMGYGYSMDELYSFGMDMVNDYIPVEFDSFYDQVSGSLLRDNDDYFAKALRYFGDSWLGSNMQDLGVTISPSYDAYISENHLTAVDDAGGFIKKESDYFFERPGSGDRGFAPALQNLVEGAKGFGFCNVWLDDDGTRRRVKLFFDHNDGFVPQLIIAPVLDELQPAEIIRKKSRLILKSAHFLSADGTETIKDLIIPLDDNGNMLINWTHNSFTESYKLISAATLVSLDEFEEFFIEELSRLYNGKLRIGNGYAQYWKPSRTLWRQYETLEQTKTALFNGSEQADDAAFRDYFAERRQFFKDCAELTDEKYVAEITAAYREAAEMDPENAAMYDAVRIEWEKSFENYRTSLEDYLQLYDWLASRLEGSIVICGHCATGSTDMGNTPFETGFPNVGTHANVYNTIMNEAFITPVPWYYGIILASVILLLLTVVFHSSSLTIQNISYVGAVLVFPAIDILLFVTVHLYIPIAAGAVIMILGALAQIILRFIMTSKDKAFIRQAFSTYLSDAVVEEIIRDPAKLALGGEEKYLTAMFTDIRSFSTLSEKVTPTQLVSFLNKYLTLLSDIILENGGTIDKYEGDAIIAFFGAPVSFEDHAWRACISAVRMKQAEAGFNEEMLSAGIIPTPVYTRIGLNTGDMVVGNMGTDAKMNYTMMGNAVNLAARLEGVNKVYHSWILVSEATWNGADSGEHAGILLGRRFDKVRVVGINTPVQLINILGVKAELDPALINSVELFHQGLDCYLAKDFARGKELFDMATAAYPQDEAAAVFARRCADNLANGVPDDWDGVVNMTSK